MIQVIPEVVEQNGRRMVKVTVKEGEMVLDADIVNPLNASSRKRAASRLAERAGDPHSAQRIESALLQCIELMDRPKPQESDETAQVHSVRVVRPELFITPEVVAISIPQVVIRGGEALGRWRLYLRYCDGRRESRELPQSVEVAGGDDAESTMDEGDEPARSSTLPSSSSAPSCSRLWIHPQPPPPAVPCVAAWSGESRQRWLQGQPAGSAREVFVELCRAFDEFLDLRDGMEKLETRKSNDESMSEAPTTEGMPASVSASEHSSRGLDSDFVIRHSNFQPSRASATLALWTLLGYAYPAWDAIPYLYISGPAGSGKTRVFELLSRLCFRPIVTSNLSAPALFRTLHDKGGTLLLDEAERLQEGSPEVAELRSILLAGYKRGGRASRLESVEGGGYSLTEFAVYGPKAIACIAGLPLPLLSRCIPVQMFRSPPDSPKPRRRLDADSSRWSTLRDQLHMLALDSLGPAALELAGRSDVCNLSGRNHELWQPILALADWVDKGGEWNLVARLADYARKLVQSACEEMVADVDQTLLRTLTEMVLAGKSPTSKEVLERARWVEEMTFRKWSPHIVSSVLRRYGLVTVKNDRRREYRPTIEQLRVVERNYGMELNTDGKDRVSVLWRAY